MFERFQPFWAPLVLALILVRGGASPAAEPAPDGPLVEVKELVGGYMIVTAGSLEEAIEVASACPGLVGPGSGVEVIEIRES